MPVTVTATGPTALRTFTLPDSSAKILTNAAVVLASEGGTGVATLNAHGVVLGNGASAVNVTSAGTAGQTLTSNGSSADPTFGPIKQTTTSTGTQNDFVLTSGATFLRCNNATLLTITGIAAGFDGQRLIIESVGAGQVDFVHQSSSSTVGNRLINYATTGNTSLAAGVGTAEFEYDATTGRWRLIAHEQGTWIAYTPTYSGNASMTWTAVTTTLMRYRLRGRDMAIMFDAVGTVGGTPNTLLQFTLPGTFTLAAAGFGVYDANLTAMGLMQMNGVGLNTLGFFKDATAAGNWVAGSARILGTVTVEVQ